MQRTKLLFLIFLWLSITKVNGQIWQHTYGYNGSYEISKGVSTSYDNGFIIGVDKNSRNFIFLKPDINGNILWQKYISNIEGNEMILSHLSMNPIGDILATGGYYPLNDVNTFVLSVNNCGEIDWCKTITVSNENFGKFVFSLPNNNILLLTYNASEYPSIDRNQLWEIDLDGNIHWMRQILPGTQTHFIDTEFFQMCLTSDGGSLMAGYTYYPFDTLNKPWVAILQPCLVKCDSLGETQWVYPPQSGADTNRIGFFRGCTQINDTYYAVGSHYDTTEFFLRPLIARFSIDGQLLSYHYLLPDTLYMQLSNVISATDTSILLISATSNQVYSDPNHLVVFIADTMGNYKKSFTRNDLVVGHFGDNVAHMKDNKFIIPCQSPLGWVGPLTDVVAIKLNANLEYDSIYTQPFTYDSLCPYPIVSDTILCNCEPFVSVKETPKVNEALAILPNPATDGFTVGFPQTLLKAGTLRVYDMLGRVQYETILSSGTKQIKINCGSWKAGLYLVRWQSVGMVMSGKVVIR